MCICPFRSLSPADGPPSSTYRSISPRGPERNNPQVEDINPVRHAERGRQLAARLATNKFKRLEKENPRTNDKDGFDAQAEFAKLTGTRSGGVYIPPARLCTLQAAAAQDKLSPEYQRLAWDTLRESITGIVNRVNITNIKNIVPKLSSKNLIRGKGLFARNTMKARATSLPATDAFDEPISPTARSIPTPSPLNRVHSLSGSDAHSPSPPPPNLGGKTSLLDLNDWVVDVEGPNVGSVTGKGTGPIDISPNRWQPPPSSTTSINMRPLPLRRKDMSERPTSTHPATNTAALLIQVEDSPSEIQIRPADPAKKYLCPQTHERHWRRIEPLGCAGSVRINLRFPEPSDVAASQ